MFEFLRSEFFLDLWSFITLGIIGSNFFLIFVLCFPLIISLFYFFFYNINKYYALNYKTFFYLKESVILFSFLYFFFFIILLIDFIYYVEIHKLFFNLNEIELKNLYNNLNRK